MKAVFFDTAAFIALGNKRDSLHQKAITIQKDLLESRFLFITTSAVLLELGNAFSAPPLKTIANTFINWVQTGESWLYIHIDETLMQVGVNRFRQFQDKGWSIVDCISMEVSQEMGIREIFTADHHFAQAGFSVLLNS